MYYKFSNNYILKKSERVALSTFRGIDENDIEHNLPINKVPYMSSFRCQNGTLINGVGINDLVDENGEKYKNSQFPLDIVYAFYYEGGRRIFGSGETRGFLLNEEIHKWELIPNVAFSGLNSTLFNVGGTPCIIIPALYGGLYIYNGNIFTEMKTTFNVKAMCSHMNRLFIVDDKDRYRLRFSAIDDPDNFAISLDEGGEIYMDAEDGKIERLISMGGNLYIFRDYAIYRLTAFGDQREFALKKVITLTSRIREGSIALKGDRIVYLTQDGAYIFDGYNAIKIMSEMDKTIKSIKGDVSSAYYQDKYYLAYKESEYGHSSLLEYDGISHLVSLSHNVDINKFCIMRSNMDDEKLLVTIYGMSNVGVIDDSATYFGKRMAKRWLSGDVDFGIYDKKKEIVSILPYLKDRYTLTIIVDDFVKRKYHIDGKDRCIKVRLSGYSYRFVIDSDNDTPIHTPVVEIKV